MTRPTLGSYAIVAGLLVCGVLASGCDTGPKLPPIARVQGVVLLDGQPLPRGVVQFEPAADQGAKGPPAVGGIDAEGRFELTTAGVKGAVVGWHRVRVEARAEPRDQYDTLPASLIPERYNNPASSGLVVEVRADQTNEVTLELTSQPSRR